MIRSMELYARGSKYRNKNYNKTTENQERHNLVNQIFKTSGKNKIGLGDITYIPTNFRMLLKQHGVIHSNSRKGNPYDNAMTESFYRTLKKELIHGAKFETPE